MKIYISDRTNTYILFELAICTCFASGGDGASTIVSENYQTMADLFGVWIKKPEHHGRYQNLQREEYFEIGINVISFWQNQEAINFTDQVPDREDIGDFVYILEGNDSKE